MYRGTRFHWGFWLSAVLLVAVAGLARAASSRVTVAATTVTDTSHNAFGHALNNLERHRWPEMLVGKRIFVRRWQPSGSGPAGLDGLGPLYNADSCTACHFKDGRGGPRGASSAPHPPLLFRLGEVPSHPFGIQLQDLATEGTAEGRVAVEYREVLFDYPDGTATSLRQPAYTLTAHPTTLVETPSLAPRVPPTLVGMGLLEAVADEEILAWADEEDGDDDGISGRPRRLADPQPRLGRFGWKAGKATLRDQTVAALREDLGILEAEEIDAEDLRKLVLYLRLLAPPARRDVADRDVATGEQLFLDIGCARCHRPQLTTGADSLPELSEQTIFPYTDLLLHDLGPELADPHPEQEADPAEWRTAPLWGLGLLSTVNGTAYFLHDGRARSFEEAVLWHGGEAEISRDRFTRLSSAERQQLLRFLESL
jgi:CxxC motif-containing protein (DUF1111 family)